MKRVHPIAVKSAPGHLSRTPFHSSSLPSFHHLPFTMAAAATLTEVDVAVYTNTEILTIVADGIAYPLDRRVFLGAKDHWKIQSLYDVATTRAPHEAVVVLGQDGSSSLAIKRTTDALYISVNSRSLEYIRVPYTCAQACERIENWIAAVLADYVPDLLDGMVTLVTVWSPTPVIHWSDALRARMQDLYGGFLDYIRDEDDNKYKNFIGSDRLAPALERAIRELGVRACFDDATDVTFIRLPRCAIPHTTFEMRRIGGKYVERVFIDSAAMRATLSARLPLTHTVADSNHMRTAYYTGLEDLVFTETLSSRRD